MAATAGIWLWINKVNCFLKWEVRGGRIDVSTPKKDSNPVMLWEGWVHWPPHEWRHHTQPRCPPHSLCVGATWLDCAHPVGKGHRRCQIYGLLKTRSGVWSWWKRKTKFKLIGPGLGNGKEGSNTEPQICGWKRAVTSISKNDLTLVLATTICVPAVSRVNYLTLGRCVVAWNNFRAMSQSLEKPWMFNVSFFPTSVFFFIKEEYFEDDISSLIFLVYW